MQLRILSWCPLCHPKRKCQDYVFVKIVSKQKIKRYLRCALWYCETLMYIWLHLYNQNLKKDKSFSIMSPMTLLQNDYHFKLYFQKADQHTGSKCLIQGSEHHKDTRLQILKFPCRIRYMYITCSMLETPYKALSLIATRLCMCWGLPNIFHLATYFF